MQRAELKRRAYRESHAKRTRHANRERFHTAYRVTRTIRCAGCGSRVREDANRYSKLSHDTMCPDKLGELCDSCVREEVNKRAR